MLKYGLNLKGLFLWSLIWSTSEGFAKATSEHSVAILGDSIAAGGGVHPDLSFDFKRVWEILLGNRPLPLGDARSEALKDFALTSWEAPHVLWPSSREFHSSVDWVMQNLLHGFSNVFFNTEQYSFGYLLARSLGAEADDIYFSAFNGARVGDLPRQIDRLMEATPEFLPRSIFILFTGNDLCAQSFAQVTSSKDFGAQLERGIQYLMTNAKPHPLGTNLYVLSPLAISQILIKPEILQKKVHAFGKEMTCQELRESSYRPENLGEAMREVPPEGLYLSQILPPNPVVYCPTLMDISRFAVEQLGFLTGFGKQNRSEVIKESLRTNKDRIIAELSTRVRSYQMSSHDAVLRVKTTLPQGYSITFIKESGSLELAGEDISQADCFHFSLEGQGKLARVVRDSMQSH